MLSNAWTQSLLTAMVTRVKVVLAWLEDDPGHEDYVKYDGTGECGEILMATLKLLQIFDHSEQKHG